MAVALSVRSRMVQHQFTAGKGKCVMEEFNNSLDKAVEMFERNIIEKTLKDVSGNQTKAASALGITKRKIQYKICKYGIDFKAIKEEYGEHEREQHIVRQYFHSKRTREKYHDSLQP
jgi:DNA-binding NtrC family response regulator